MLVLSRKVGESVVIGDSIRVTVTLVKGNRVKLGVEAPPEVKVIRGELDNHDHTEAASGRAPLTFSLMADSGTPAVSY